MCCIMMFRWIDINSQEYKCFETDVVTIKISMTKYHRSLWGKMSMVNPAIFYFHFFEALHDTFDVQFCQGFIFKHYQRHWLQLRFLKVKQNG